MNTKKGITAAGNWIIDRTKLIDDYPPQDGLCNIREESVSNGGSPYNILKALSKMGFEDHLYGIGILGEDTLGKKILDDCRLHQINTAGITCKEKVDTSYTDVMTSIRTGRRTFFHNRGANSFLSRSYIEKHLPETSFFHLGYVLLLDQLDQFSKNYPKRTEASLLLENIQNKGIKTSIDLVSEHSDRFQSVVKPSLPYVDYLFLNEYEAEKLVGISILKNQKLDLDAAKKNVINLMDMGVNEAIFLHFKDGAICFTKKHEFYIEPKLMIPQENIKGTSGAGDAFAAGVLYALYTRKNCKVALQWGVATAAKSLEHPSCSEAIGSLVEIQNLYKTYHQHIL
ncbi:carbohydrate kinase family protein [Aquimarina sp. U1-2]|uniref:carbohydrate kinase family protein n=1 Tax=Aquimarina sp. U1-2 TaxID=2823141 RepID=UPI001AEC8C8E|nr:carbohydrate kinase family protein [Aquimarina sp. U1-2]MBP2832902.1 carbohydrate kinase family protein [Aquimarina sp. U1-2]